MKRIGGEVRKPTSTCMLASHQNDQIKFYQMKILPRSPKLDQPLPHFHYTKAWTWRCCNALSLALTIRGMENDGPCLTDLACHHHRLISGLSDDLITI